VITKCAASSLACAAAERKFTSRGSFSKYSTRHGAQSVSNSFFGNSDMSAAYLKRQATQDAMQIYSVTRAASMLMSASRDHEL
jgi:hypothetical protein